ncbi:hypothetical protein DL767_010249 [Monosporascus sp. MG133]|nr:hypothetical protein DL767_010249 [Monosporascus sp. MG133]
MVVKGALTAHGCYQCRSAVLKLFTSPLSPASFTRTTTPVTTLSGSVALPLTKRFSSTIRKAESSSDQHASGQHLEDDGIAKNEGEAHVLPEDSSASDVPWYLQVEPPRHVAAVEPPPLPEVPSDSPAVVGSLVEYASEEMGLDDLSLLDLRKLDPPPALGPNLFMLFGTARSERHLNVSAGRLLRWLRYKHRIWADADGFLGPNERKTKLRRKAKRAKLLGTMGTDDTDDGLSTGWICVNLGTIGRGGGESAVVDEGGRAAGFGVVQSGFTIVVQLMTEYRRAEMDLEALWLKALNPPTLEESLPPQAGLRETEKKTDLHPLEKALLSSSPKRQNARNSRAKDSPFGQASFYSTKTDPLRGSPEELSHLLSYDFQQKRRVLDLLRARLNELTPGDSRRTLGETRDGQVSTPFLELFELASKHLPKSKTWEYRLAVQAKARESGHTGSIATLDDVRDLIQEMRLSGLEVTREHYLQLLACIYSSSGADTKEQSQLAVELLRTMHQRGHSILANDVVAKIIEAKLLSGEQGAGSGLELAERLRHLAVQAELPCPDEPTLTRLMTAYAARGHWDAFWDAWRSPPRYLRPRSRALYLHVFRTAAATRDSSLCGVAARQCFPEMLFENPPVRPVGDVRDALLQCVRVADAGAEKHAETIPADSRGAGRMLANREFVRLVRTLKNMG